MIFFFFLELLSPIKLNVSQDLFSDDMQSPTNNGKLL